MFRPGKLSVSPMLGQSPFARASACSISDPEAVFWTGIIFGFGSEEEKPKIKRTNNCWWKTFRFRGFVWSSRLARSILGHDFGKLFRINFDFFDERSRGLKKYRSLSSWPLVHQNRALWNRFCLSQLLKPKPSQMKDLRSNLVAQLSIKRSS